MADETVLYDRTGNIAIITLNRPDRLNASNLELVTGLVKRLDKARRDNDVACVILTGAGRAFCAGADLKVTTSGMDLEEWKAKLTNLQEVQRAMLRLGKPLIAAVRGYAVGGGCEFAMSCDIRIAAYDAKFGFPETGVGLTVTTAGTKLLSQLVGIGKAKELIFTGEFIDAKEAERIGLVNKVVAVEDLIEEALNTARQIANRSPLALRLSRAAIEQGLHSDFEDTLRIEADHLLTCVSDDGYLDYVNRRLNEMKRS